MERTSFETLLAPALAGIRRLCAGRITPTPAWPVYADSAVAVAAPQMAGLRRLQSGLITPVADSASLVGGRWNSPGLGVIYASRSYAGAMLECLAHAGIGRVPRSHVVIEIAIAAAVSVERHDESSLPAGWDHADLRVARAFGDAWIRERRTAVLVVPSVVARREGNVLLNPQHPDFRKISAGSPEPVVWDARLFGRH